MALASGQEGSQVISGLCSSLGHLTFIPNECPRPVNFCICEMDAAISKELTKGVPKMLWDPLLKMLMTLFVSAPLSWRKQER